MTKYQVQTTYENEHRDHDEDGDVEPLLIEPPLQTGHALVGEEEAAQRGQRTGRVHLATALTRITVAVVVVTRRARLRVQVGHVVGGGVPLEGGPEVVVVVTDRQRFN